MIHPLGEYMKLPLVRQGVRIRESGTIARAEVELPAGQANRGGEKEDLADVLFRMDGRYVVAGRAGGGLRRIQRGSVEPRTRGKAPFAASW